MIRARRVRRVVQSELVIEFQDNLGRGKGSDAERVELPFTLSGRQVGVASTEPAGLQVFISVTVEWDDFPSVTNEIGELDMISGFQ